ncbi:hypothetical protein LXT21_32870 [Myxococcus sp. K38C18041901]|uniref:hypothetical protein n=1 Tax=Myxococcus guangdongensis TaxID=2906760 RepID=UPI0020A810B7|nr:hypothetical protein [Myxococcus guangdongensis]MCP3063579.1 hypothetical protein [Myxococcus guangdongensis]
MRTHPRPGAGWLLLVVALLASCNSNEPYFIAPGITSPQPSKPARTTLTLACEAPPRRLFIPEKTGVRWFGPMKARVILETRTTTNAEQKPLPAYLECIPPVPCELTAPKDSVLELSVGKLESTTHEWGMICLCKGGECPPDCVNGKSRIDVRVSCPATRFALYEKYGRISAPLPAHLPLDITCRPSPEDSTKLDCNPILVSLDKGPLTVAGALRLAKEPNDVQANDVLVFKATPDAKGKDQDVHLCLHGTCSNPAYFLPLRVDFEPVTPVPPRP